MQLEPGTRFGDFEIQGVLGAGGMGDVYRARDTKLGRSVALKVISSILLPDPERLARFQREAQVLASLNHPNIAAIYGLAEAKATDLKSAELKLGPTYEGDVEALVLELVEGPTLADRIAAGPIPIDEALPIARQIADALQAAHDSGIIHRDLKPANIKVRDDGAVKVLDFGLAKLTTPEVMGMPSQVGVTQSPTITTPAMTAAGLILGTAAYMSPEQAKGRPADKRSDVWAFGAVLYEMLSGKRAFAGEDISDTLAAVLRDEPDWNALPANVPESLRALLRRCLAKDRGQRAADISVARFVMSEPAAGTTVASGIPSSPRGLASRYALALIASAVTAAITGAAMQWLRPTPPTPAPIVTRFTYELGAERRFTNLGRRALAISPDGTRMAFVINSQLFLKSMWDAEAAPLRGTESPNLTGVTTPTFAPDGQSLVFWTANELRRIPVSGGAPVTLAQALDNPFGISWEGEVILIGGGAKGILRVPVKGGAIEVAIPVATGEAASSPQLLPDGQTVLYTLRENDQAPDDSRIVAQRLGSPDRRVIIETGSNGQYVDTGRVGHVLYMNAGILFAVTFDVRQMKTVGTPRAVVEGVARVTPASLLPAGQFAMSKNGSLAYIPGPAGGGSAGWTLATFDREGKVDTLKLPQRVYGSPRFAPDSRRIVFDITDGKSTNVWVYELSGTNAPRQLTFEGNNQFPLWSPDGAKVVFQSDRERDAGLFWQPASGTGVAERLTRSATGETHVPESWFPTHDKLLFAARAADGNSSLLILDVHTKVVEPFVKERFIGALPHAVVSPDGKWVAYSVTGQVVYVQPYPATGAKYRVGEGVNPMWSPGGSSLYISTPNTGRFQEISVRTRNGFETGSQPSVIQRPQPAGGGPSQPRQYDVAPNGASFITATPADNRSGAVASKVTIVLNWTEELKQRVPTR